jgi:hypothetical protein
MGNRRHFFQFEEVFSEKIVTKLHNYGTMRLCPLCFYWARAPTMRHVGTEQYKIARAVVRDAIADQPLSATVDNQSQFELWVIMPVEWKFRITSLKRNDQGGSGADFLEIRLHAPIGPANIVCDDLRNPGANLFPSQILHFREVDGWNLDLACIEKCYPGIRRHSITSTFLPQKVFEANTCRLQP